MFVFSHIPKKKKENVKTTKGRLILQHLIESQVRKLKWNTSRTCYLHLAPIPAFWESHSSDYLFTQSFTIGKTNCQNRPFLLLLCLSKNCDLIKPPKCQKLPKISKNSQNCKKHCQTHNGPINWLRDCLCKILFFKSFSMHFWIVYTHIVIILFLGHNLADILQYLLCLLLCYFVAVLLCYTLSSFSVWVTVWQYFTICYFFPRAKSALAWHLTSPSSLTMPSTVK